MSRFLRYRSAAAVVVLVLVGGCLFRDVRWGGVRPPRQAEPSPYVLITTGYCRCGECCGWKRNWLFRPVIAYGPNKGEPKKVGITASGVPAKHGTIAADTSIFPFGTVMYIPGYGYGVVEDRGGDIKGYHIDLYFSSHQEALEWGRKKQRVKVWFGPSAR